VEPVIDDAAIVEDEEDGDDDEAEGVDGSNRDGNEDVWGHQGDEAMPLQSDMVLNEVLATLRATIQEHGTKSEMGIKLSLKLADVLTSALPEDVVLNRLLQNRVVKRAISKKIRGPAGADEKKAAESSARPYELLSRKERVRFNPAFSSRKLTKRESLVLFLHSSLPVPSRTLTQRIYENLKVATAVQVQGVDWTAGGDLKITTSHQANTPAMGVFILIAPTLNTMHTGIMWRIKEDALAFLAMIWDLATIGLDSLVMDLAGFTNLVTDAVHMHIPDHRDQLDHITPML
jgi:hypothetical protein